MFEVKFQLTSSYLDFCIQVKVQYLLVNPSSLDKSLLQIRISNMKSGLYLISDNTLHVFGCFFTILTKYRNYTRKVSEREKTREVKKPASTQAMNHFTHFFAGATTINFRPIHPICVRVESRKPYSLFSIWPNFLFRLSANTNTTKLLCLFFMGGGSGGAVVDENWRLRHCWMIRMHAHIHKTTK